MKRRCFGRRAPWLAAVGAALVTVVILLVVYGLCELAPFGTFSLAIMDADIQYLDFFAYFKDVLAGENSIDYTFSFYLGGNTFGLYAYYLSSPISFLVALFPKEQIPLFFDIAVLIKLTLCSATMAYYLVRRFHVNTMVRLPICIALSLGYALSVWTTCQASNIMWLDAAYLLPVMFLGIWRGVREERWWVFSVAVGCSLMFGWYSGAMNCVFSPFWLLFETVVAWNELGDLSTRRFKRAAKILLGYVLSGVVGVALSAIVLVPMLFSVVGSSRGTLNLGMLTDFRIRRNPLMFVQDYALGSSVSTSLYAGTLPLIGLMGVFCAKRSARRQKAVIACGFALLVVMLFWGPFIGLFSLLHRIDSYHIRYSYLVIAGAVTFSGFYLLKPSSSFLKGTDTVRLILVAAGFFVAQLLLTYVFSENTTGQLVPTIVFEVVLLLLIAIGSRKGRRLVCACLLATVACLEAGTNAEMVFESMRKQNVDTFAVYVDQTERSIASLKEREGSTPFRISAITKRRSENESLAFNYDSIVSYSSVAPPDQISLLNSLGYPTHGSCMTIIPEAILPTDALLGVKYLASAGKVYGLASEDAVLEQKVFNNSRDEMMVSFYENPYAFPLAFRTRATAETASHDFQQNIFEYMNSVLDALLGANDVYEEVGFEVECTESEDGTEAIYRVDAPTSDAVIYGDLSCAATGPCMVDLGNGASFGYKRWNARRVFAVPVDLGEEGSIVTCTGVVENDLLAQFYEVKLDRLVEAARIANERAAAVERFENGSVSLRIEAQQDERLFLSIANDARWHAYVNGEEVLISTAMGCLMMIPLEEGMNQVELHYEALSYLPGAGISMLAVLVMVGYGLYRRKS